MMSRAPELESCPSVPGAVTALINHALLCFPIHQAFMDMMSFSIQQPCTKISLQQVGVRKDGRMSLEIEGESDKNRERFSGGQTREGRRMEGVRGQKKYVSLPNFVWGSSQTCSAAFKYLTIFPNETPHPKERTPQVPHGSSIME